MEWNLARQIFPGPSVLWKVLSPIIDTGSISSGVASPFRSIGGRVEFLQGKP